MSDSRRARREELYGLPLPDFVGARNTLAAELRKAGRAGEAAEVKRLKKPTPVAWTIDQVARQDPEGIARFVEAVDRLRRVQLGEKGTMAAAAEAEREARHRLLDRAAAVLAQAGLRASADTVRRLSSTLLGAAADRAMRADLQHGRLTQELAPPGLDLLLAGGAGSAPPPKSASRAAASGSAQPRRGAANRTATDTAKTPRGRAKGTAKMAASPPAPDRDGRARAAPRQARAAQRQAREAQRHARQAQRALERRIREATRQAERLEKAAASRRAHAEDAERAAAEQRERLRELLSAARRQ